MPRRARARGSIKQVPGPRLRFHYDPEQWVVFEESRWEAVARPRRTDTVEWTGATAPTAEVELLFDEYPNGNVEPELALLHKMMLPHAVRNGRDFSPPKVRVSFGRAHRNFDWAITSITEGDQLRRRDGVRCRQWVTVGLIRHSETRVLVTPTESRRRRRGGGSGRTIVVKKGQTLHEISRRHFGHPGRWMEIFARNRRRIGDPDRLKPGTRLRLPER